MLVSENNIFKPDVMMLNIVESDGATWVTEVQRNMTVEKIKLLALTHVTSHHNNIDNYADANSPSSGSSLFFKLLHAQTGRVLSDNGASLAQEGVFDGDELIMVRERLPTLTTLQEMSGKCASEAPGKEEIAVVTAGLDAVHQEKDKTNAGAPPLDFQSELPRILVSLIESAQRILCLSKEANELFDMQSRLAEEIKTAENTEETQVATTPPPVDEDESLVEQLKEMGFPEDRSREALRRTKNDSISAMDWLLENEKNEVESSSIRSSSSSSSPSPASSPSCDERVCHVGDVTTGETDDGCDDRGGVDPDGAVAAAAGAGSAATVNYSAAAGAAAGEVSMETLENGITNNGVRSSSNDDDVDDDDNDDNDTTRATTFRSVAEILELYRLYKRKTFNPNTRALQTLMEMGFAEKEVEDALRLHNNNQSAACDWLLGDRSNRPSSTNPESFQGLDLDSSLYEAIMTNPIVQMGLNNTRCLHAFLSMLENPSTTTHYLNDTEVGPVLLQVSRIYHAEKHGIAPPSGSSIMGGNLNQPFHHHHHHHHHQHGPHPPHHHHHHHHPRSNSAAPSSSSHGHHAHGGGGGNRNATNPTSSSTSSSSQQQEQQQQNNHHHHHHPPHGHSHGGGHGHAHLSHGHSHHHHHLHQQPDSSHSYGGGGGGGGVDSGGGGGGSGCGGCPVHVSRGVGQHHHHHHHRRPSLQQQPQQREEAETSSDTPTGTGNSTPTNGEDGGGGAQFSDDNQ